MATELAPSALDESCIPKQREKLSDILNTTSTGVCTEEAKQEKSADETVPVECVEGECVEGTVKVESEVPSEAQTPIQTPSFKEESYKVGELKEAERKALEELRLKVEEAIKSKSFFKKEKKKVVVIETPVAAVTTEIESTEVEIKGSEAVASAEGIDCKTEETELSRDVAAAAPECPDKTVLAAEEEQVAETAVEAGPKNFYVWDIPVVDESEAEAEAKQDVVTDADQPEAEATAEIKTSKTDVLLLKFLRARKWKADEAFAMLKNTIKWRKEFDVDGLLLEEEKVEEEEAEFRELALTHGVDKGGHPVCYNSLGSVEGVVNDKARFQRFLRWRVRVMERSVRTLDFTPGGVNSILQVIDLQQSAGSSIKAVPATTKQFLALLKDNYPELAAKQIILNMPWWYLPALYRFLRQQPKVVWAGPGKSTETLFKYVSPDQVPIQYGGLSRPNDTDFHEGVVAPIHELTVKAGEKRDIELPVEQECGGTLVWDVSVVGWDVVYAEEFVPKVYTVVVRKPSKIEATHREAIRNSYKAAEPGKLVISIDNSLSKKKKLVIYRFASKDVVVV